VYVNGNTSGYFGYPYISVLSKADTAGSVLAKNPFDEDNYSSDDFETRSASGITFTPADGKFTVDEPGLYVVAFAGVYSLNSGGTVDITIAVNGTTVVTQGGKIANGPDPLDRTAIAFLELNQGDYIEVFYDMEAGKPVVAKSGTQISIYRYFGFFKTEDTVAGGLINEDHTINTFSQENLSNQYPRNTDQVPFRFGIRGAGSLRGRDTQVASVVNIGDKKS